MKITIYDLLGLIKEGKAPKKIDTYDYLWTFNNDEKDYVNGSNILLFGEYSSAEITTFLNDEVEVIEEEKKIEKLNLDTDELKGKETVRAIDYLLECKINELIDVINDMRDKE